MESSGVSELLVRAGHQKPAGQVQCLVSESDSADPLSARSSSLALTEHAQTVQVMAGTELCGALEPLAFRQFHLQLFFF